MWGRVCAMVFFGCLGVDVGVGRWFLSLGSLFSPGCRQLGRRFVNPSDSLSLSPVTVAAFFRIIARSNVLQPN